MELPTIAIIVIVISCIVYLGMFVFAIVYFFFWDRKGSKKSTDIGNSYLDDIVEMDTTENSPHTNTNDPVYENEDVSSKMVEVLEDMIKRRFSSLNIENNRLNVGEKIGQGHFGEVYKAELLDRSFNNPTVVAVKTVCGDQRTDADINSFLDEVKRMNRFQHHNVMSVIGLVMRDKKPFAVLPFMENGDLGKYMSDQTKTFTKGELLTFAVQISDGMDYISKQGFVHRDLAARNCMVTEDQTVKVADFGLSRDLSNSDYYRMNDPSKPTPFKWMAIESIKDSVFTRESDVWSFGVVLWEIMTRGKTPYMGMMWSDVKEYIERGERLAKPASTPVNVYSIMTSCWKANPKDRPTFSKISKELHTLLRR